MLKKGAIQHFEGVDLNPGYAPDVEYFFVSC